MSCSVSETPAAIANAHEIVVHEVQRKHVQVVFQLLAETVGQAREAAHTHAHCQVLALNVGRADQSFTGWPVIASFLMPVHSAGLYFFS